MNEVLSVLEQRLHHWVSVERASAEPLIGLTQMFTACMRGLVALQKMRFDLGLDEYRRGKPPVARLDPHVEQQLWESYRAVEEILDRRGIPNPVELRSDYGRDDIH